MQSICTPPTGHHNNSAAAVLDVNQWIPNQIQSIMHNMNWFSGLISLCHAAAVPGVGRFGLPVLLLFTGFAGSLVHCGPMCGAFVLAQASDAMACIPSARLSERARFFAGALPLYHAGRITTYAALGAAFAQGVAVLARAALLHRLGGGLMLVAALLLAMEAMQRWVPKLPLPSGLFLWRAVRPLAQRLRALGPLRHYLTGLLLGFLPCGFLGAALLAAGSSGSAAQGALAMAGFGLGTVPLLALLGVMGGRGVSLRLRPAIPFLLLGAAFLLAVIGAGQFGAV